MCQRVRKVRVRAAGQLGQNVEPTMRYKIRHALIAMLLAGFLPSVHAAINKCTDGESITYTDKPCEKLGLKDAGPLKDTVTYTHAMPVPAAAPAPKASGQGGAADTAQEPAAPDANVYQCTNYYGVVSFSGSPCTESSFVPQLKTYVPAQQQTVTKGVACEKIGADADLKARSSISCE